MYHPRDRAKKINVLLAKRVLTGLRTGVKEGARRLDCHGGQCSIRNLRARVSPAPRPCELVRLTGLPSEIATADHLLGGRLASKTASDQNLFCRGLASDWWSFRGRVT